jgi:hypothetical protein
VRPEGLRKFKKITLSVIEISATAGNTVTTIQQHEKSQILTRTTVHREHIKDQKHALKHVNLPVHILYFCVHVTQFLSVHIGFSLCIPSTREIFRYRNLLASDKPCSIKLPWP